MTMPTMTRTEKQIRDSDSDRVRVRASPSSTTPSTIEHNYHNTTHFSCPSSSLMAHTNIQVTPI